MDHIESISIDDFCQYYKVEISFVQSLEDLGLIEVVTVDKKAFIPFDEMSRLEKFVRMHYDLDINAEGLETIDHLLRKIEELQDELTRLRGQTHDF